MGVVSVYAGAFGCVLQLLGSAMCTQACGCGYNLCRTILGCGQCVYRVYVGVVIVSEGANGRGHRVCSEFGCGHCFCTNMNVGIVSIWPCGCGHCLYRCKWAWSQSEQSHGGVVKVFVRT